MASEELGTIHELLSGFDLRGLTPRQRRAAMESVARPAPEGTVIDPVEANGVSAEWVAAAGVELLPEADQAVERIGEWLRERVPAC